jgi:hypothetical protein
MSHLTKLLVSINDLDIFSEVCEEKGFDFNESKREVRFGNRYIGSLVDTKDDRGDPICQFQTDSDFIGNSRLAQNVPDVNKIMQAYSEKVCCRSISRIGGTIVSREENEQGIRLKIVVNG